MNALIKPLLLSLLFFPSLYSFGDDAFGTLIFQDDFERSESQETKDEPGNEWTTSSDKTAKGNKQVDLRDGYMYIYTHAEANHATSVRHAFEFQNGTIGLKVKFDEKRDSILLNFTDMGEKSVHAGHLFNVIVSPTDTQIIDLKTGIMNQVIRSAKKANELSAEQKKLLNTKGKRFPHPLATGEWHQVYATVTGDEVTCTINGIEVGTFRSPGFAHDTKTLIRLLVPYNVSVDEVKIWRKD